MLPVMTSKVLCGNVVNTTGKDKSCGVSSEVEHAMMASGSHSIMIISINKVSAFRQPSIASGSQVCSPN